MPDNLKNVDVLLIGAGYMAVEYAKVLKDLNRKFIVVGRGEESAKKFEEKTGIQVHRGGLNDFISTHDTLPSYAIIAVNAPNLAEACLSLLQCGVKNILVEKPGALNFEDFQKIRKIMKEKSAEVSVAYNRRFYASVRKVAEIIKEDGGVTSFQFEFTEWLHVLEESGRLAEVLPYLFFSNSTHVVDLAFFLCGKPKEITCYKMATMPKYTYSSLFAGVGISEHNAPFTYQANWMAPGRWGVEILTNKHRLILRPLEKLQIQHLKSVKTDFVEIEDSLDNLYKPGLFLETQAFLDKNENFKNLCSFEEQCNMLHIYKEMSE